MGSLRLTLPKDNEEAAKVVRRHAEREEANLVVRRTRWLLAYYYLNGYRRFDSYDPNLGTFTPYVLDENGNMEFEDQELLYNINQVAGYIQSMNLYPSVTTDQTTLTAMRQKAVGQVLFNGTLSEQEVVRAQEELAWLFACLGSVGLTGHVEDHPAIGLTSSLEVIHPKEILPFPSHGQDHTKNAGIVRQRIMPLSHLKELYPNRFKGGDPQRETGLYAKLDYVEVDPGSSWADDDLSSQYGGMPFRTMWGSDTGIGFGSTHSQKMTGKSKKDKGDTIFVVKVRELWLYGPEGTVSEYLLTSGDYMIDRKDFSQYETYCPIGFARFLNNSTFHGAGMFDLMFSQHRQLELLEKSLYQNVQNIDRYGVLVLPQGDINQETFLRDVGEGLKVAMWEPSPISEGMRPFSITPFNSGDMPGKVAQFSRAALQQINPMRDLLQEKGRVDSASGLQFLQEQINKSMTTGTHGIANLAGVAYRALAQKVSVELLKSDRALPTGSLSLDLAGVVIDSEDGKVQFDNNPLPSVRGLIFGIKEAFPKSQVAMKQEAIQLWQIGIEQDPLNFRLYALKNGLDFAMYVDDDKGAYEATIRAILMLYGDGNTPGRLILTPETVKPELALRIVESFMVGPAMQVAGPEVMNSFKALRQFLIQSMGMMLPNAIPAPEDLAAVGLPPVQGPEGQAPAGMGGVPQQQGAQQ